MSLLKPLLLLGSASLYAVAITPPQPPVTDGVVYKGQLYEYIVRYVSYLAGATIMVPTILHTILLVYPEAHSLTIAPSICPAGAATTTGLASLTPTFLAGLALLTAGALTRLWSYHVLGALFTFEVVIKDDHKLISTGPYAHVRHPAYTGMVLLTAGAYLLHFWPGGYVAECALERVPALTLLAWAWRLTSVFGFVSLYRRCAVEDAKLRKEFGAGWERYRQQVPYALVPYLL